MVLDGAHEARIPYANSTEKAGITSEWAREFQSLLLSFKRWVNLALIGLILFLSSIFTFALENLANCSF